MPQPDPDIVRAVLGHVLAETRVQELDPRSGTLRATETNFTSGKAAFEAFAKLDGPGWLQEAHTPEILHTADPDRAAQLAALKPDAAWPVTGERTSADGKTSFHLRRSSEGWIITTLEETSDAAGLLLTQRLVSTDLKHYLLYHVAYRPERIGGHEELRPFASRFIGFEPVKPASSTSTEHVQPAAS